MRSGDTMGSNAARIVLGVLFAFVALNAVGGGVYGVTGAKAIPAEWLAGSPFDDYFVPSLFLLFGVGGSQLAAAIAVFARRQTARHFVFGASAILLGWICVQVAIIGYVSWMQPAMLIAGLAEIALARAAAERLRPLA